MHERKRECERERDMIQFHHLHLTLLMIMFHASPTYAQEVPFYTSCDLNESNYTSNSTFGNNIRLLLPSLVDASRREGHFYRTVVGEGLNHVYGLVLCRGDVTSGDCSSCITTAGAGILERCNSKSAIIWYDNCLLRYSTENFFNSTSNFPWVYGWNSQNASDEGYVPIAEGLMSHLTFDAVNETWRRRFATREYFTSLTSKVYGLVQCIPDMASGDCSQCLQHITTNIRQTQCNAKSGCRYLGALCQMRYETYEFYGPSAIAQQPQAPPPMPPPAVTLQTPASTHEDSSSRRVAILVSTITIPVLLIVLIVTWTARKTRLPKKSTSITVIESQDFFQFDFNTIRAATDDFSNENKLGKGGFGMVYKGKLADGQEIAVKRLSMNSRQGGIEFRNEVAVVAKLQHRNLVRLFGGCVEGEEKLLIYEYIPNRSLDYFLFDPSRRAALKWEHRYKIIGGILRGLQYLHEDSRLRIIHRDLKASNILLDAEMNAKISDFGMAKMFIIDEDQGNTDRIAGTFGYMSPEYAMHGKFSVKSDVFSFGVLILEIVSGQKNSSFCKPGCGEDIGSYAWRAWKSGTILDMIDPAMSQQCSKSDVERCIHIGLLFVQEDPIARPNISSIIRMLNNFSLTSPTPMPPAFFISNGNLGPHFQALERPLLPNNSSSSSAMSLNCVTITELGPR